MLPLLNVKKQFDFIHDELMEKINSVLQSGQYILGPNVEELERNIADRIGTADAIAVANGTDALVLTLKAYGIGEGDEVITTPFTFFATAEAITQVGATPVFADIERKTFNLDPGKLEDKISSATKAILPVHLFGQPARMDEITAIASKHGLIVIEDACQAFGAQYNGRMAGNLGDAACFSFFPTKNLGTAGDGGIVTTSDPVIAGKIRSLRAHGSSKKYFHDEIGFNSRLDEIHAAILLTSLKHIDEWNNNRITIADRYKEKLKNTTNIQCPEKNINTKHVYHLFCVESPCRDEMVKYLMEKKIQTGIYYPCCVHLQAAYKYLNFQEGDFPVAEALSKRLFAIPLHPFLSTKEQDLVIAALQSFEVKKK
ncbi:DegT/DnrJ/EryC1/StrS family aminotransferase [Alteribacillus sp. HJP-4]|uniref:DegT/DnrJ/EryC1/StrS family aminotransferase n=1 Tax=Alteribacillus sp. HJP-4 TaxID=2775394 RepID=UPI0035CD1C91